MQKSFSFVRMPSPQHDPGAWTAHLARYFPFVRDWSVSPYLAADAARAKVGEFMPELLPDVDALLPGCAEIPGAAQGLVMYNPRAFWAGCSESIAVRADRKTLIRNYDLGPDGLSGVFRFEELAGGGWILGSAEAGLGYLDGINDRGLAVSLTFGGRFVIGDGFSLLIVIRWLLQTCSTVAEALERLKRVPHRLAQNLLLLDRTGDHAVAYLSPDRPVTVERGRMACSNHQQEAPQPEQEAFTHTVARLSFMDAKAGALSLADFLRPPLYNQRYREFFGTLYTVEYDPFGLTAHFAWPDRDLLLTPASPATSFQMTFTQAE